MIVSVVPIGNSKGIRIPKAVLDQYQIEDAVDLELHDNGIVLKPISRNPREGWKKAFAKMAERGEDTPLLDGLPDNDAFEWEW